MFNLIHPMVLLDKDKFLMFQDFFVFPGDKKNKK